MYRIGDFSKLSQLSVKTLRYYDEIGLLKPTQTNPENGYRYYDDVSYQQAQTIQVLRRFEFTIQEMLEILPRIQQPSDLSDFLCEKREQLESRILSARQRQREIDHHLHMMKEETFMEHLEPIEIVEMPSIQVACIRYKGRYEELGSYLGELFKAVGMNAAGTPFSLYYDEDYQEEQADIEVAVPVKKPVSKGAVTTRTIEAQRCLRLVHVGPYERLSDSYKIMMDYREAHGLTTCVPSREIYVKGPGMLMKGNPKHYRTEILMPLQSE